jgi:hypothetical protein
MLRANSRSMKRIIFVVETPQAGSDQPITLGWNPASNPEGGERVPTGQVQVWAVPLNDHLGPSLCRRRSLLWLSSRLPGRNAEPVVRCSRVPQPYIAPELTQSVAPPQVCHCCKGEGGRGVVFKPIGENLRWRKNRFNGEPRMRYSSLHKMIRPDLP